MLGWLVRGPHGPCCLYLLVMGLEVCITTPGLFRVGTRDKTHAPMLVRQALN